MRRIGAAKLSSRSPTDQVIRTTQAGKYQGPVLAGLVAYDVLSAFCEEIVKTTEKKTCERSGN